MDKPEALRLADWFEGGYGGCELEAAAELRRLVAENALLHERHHFDNGVLKELLEALKYHQEQTRPIERTRAAIAKAEGQA